MSTTTNADKAAFIQDFYAKLVLQGIASDRFNLKPTKPQLRAALDAANDAADLLFDPPPPTKQTKQTKQFKIVATSRNTNSFGLHGIILIARDGEAWEIGVNYMHAPSFKDGALVTLGLDANGNPEFGPGVEIPRRLRGATTDVIEELWGKNAVTR